MKSSAVLTTGGLLALLPILVSLGHTQAKPAAAPASHSRFEQFKALDGEWTGKEAGFGADGETKITYHVTSGGTAVNETIGPGSDHEMITMITKDGADIALTHYCAMGNQPHMKALDSDTSNVVAFKFTNAGNMTSPSDTHMHNVTYTFVDKDTLKAEWSLYVKGKPSGGVTFNLKRKK